MLFRLMNRVPSETSRSARVSLSQWPICQQDDANRVQSVQQSRVVYSLQHSETYHLRIMKKNEMDAEGCC